MLESLPGQKSSNVSAADSRTDGQDQGPRPDHLQSQQTNTLSCLTRGFLSKRLLKNGARKIIYMWCNDASMDDVFTLTMMTMYESGIEDYSYS